jgi:predicted nucleic acid-binding Zn ribbon protein
VSSERRDDDPVPIGDALARVRAELGLPDGDALRVLVERWSEVVGADVAAHARLDALRDGTLVVVTDDPIWASQLRYLQGAILDRANELAGSPVVDAVRVRVRPR